MGANMIEAAVPEQWDGGYWYVVDAITDPNWGGRRTPGDIPGVGWCAQYFGSKVLVRTPDTVSLSTADSAANFYKFRARIGGL